MTTKTVKVNYHALKAFRDTADKDYISARMAYKANLIPQFHWSGLHALEKYAKCVLILARIKKPSRYIGHEIKRAFNHLSKNNIKIKTSEQTDKFITKLEKFGARDRYLEESWWIIDHEITSLDRAVWEIRRYCNSNLYDYSSQDEAATLKSNNPIEIEDIQSRKHENTYIEDGFIEKTLSDKRSAARKELVWNNFFYASKKRNKLNLRAPLQIQNSPFFLYPEIIEEVVKYVHVSKKIVNTYNKVE